MVESSRPQASATPLPQGVTSRLGLLLSKLGDEVVRRAEPRLLDDARLSPRSYLALAVLERDQPDSQQVLAHLLGKVPALVVAIIDELEAAGYVERTRDPEDRRRTRVKLTRTGRAALTRGDRVAATVEAELFGDLGPDVLELLERALRDSGAAA